MLFMPFQPSSSSAHTEHVRDCCVTQAIDCMERLKAATPGDGDVVTNLTRLYFRIGVGCCALLSCSSLACDPVTSNLSSSRTLCSSSLCPQ